MLFLLKDQVVFGWERGKHALPDATILVCDSCLYIHDALFQPAFDFYVVNHNLLFAGRHSANKSNVRLPDLAFAIKEQRLKRSLHGCSGIAAEDAVMNEVDGVCPPYCAFIG